HGSAAHEPFDVVPTQTLPPRGARHAAARRTVWQCVTPLASVRQHRTALGRPQVERAAQARSCALHSSESVPLLTAARAAPAPQLPPHGHGTERTRAVDRGHRARAARFTPGVFGCQGGASGIRTASPRPSRLRSVFGSQPNSAAGAREVWVVAE